MANVTKGSITSQFPDALPVFTAQSETLDTPTEDATLAQGRDANKWSAEIQAITEAVGFGGRAGVSIAALVATVESLRYVYQGTQKSYTGTTSLSLFSGQNNKIYLDPEDNEAKVTTTSWPSNPHLRLASYDDSGSGVAVLTDERPHDLKFSGETPAFARVAGWHIDANAATIAESTTNATISFGVTFSAAPIVNVSVHRPGDSTLRKVGFSNLTASGMTIHIDTAAPAGGVEIHWMAIGLKSTGVSGSGA